MSILKRETSFENFIKGIEPNELKNWLVEYVAETNHNSWDGWSPRDRTGARALMQDLMLYYTSVGALHRIKWSLEGNDLLEDRLEYDRDDLAKAYPALSEKEVDELYAWIQGHLK